MNPEKITYIQYARKSSEGEDRQALSIPAQLRDNAEVIKRNNLLLIDTITDEASAAIPYNRKGYTEMIARLKKGEASGIVVWHVDRLIRNPLEEGEFKWLLQTGVIKSIWTPGREYRSEDNGLLFSIEASMAAQYSRDLSVKVRRGLKQKFEMGQPATIAPLGYSNTKFQMHGTNYLVSDPLKFTIVRKGFDLMLTGAYTVQEIATILFKDYGLRSSHGMPISKSTLYRSFTNMVYYGYFERHGVIYKGSYPAMITVKEYDQIQDVLVRAGKPRYKRHLFALTGFMTCGSCGSAITATEKRKWVKATGQFKNYTFYHCTKRKKGNAMCTERHYTTQKEMECMIINELLQYQVHPAFKEWAIEYYQTKYGAEIEKTRSLAKALNGQEQKLKHELDVLLDLRISGSVTEEKFQEKKTEKEALLIRLNEQKVFDADKSLNWMQVVEGCLAFAVGAVEAFKKGDEKTKKSICLQFGWDWVLKDKKLFSNKQEWLLPIKNMKEICEYYLGRFELTKCLVKSDYNPLINYLRFNMRRLCNYVGTRSQITGSNFSLKKRPNHGEY